MQTSAKMITETRPMADQLIKLWVKFRNFLRHGMSEQPITREQDQAFLEAKSQISKLYSQLRGRLPSQLTGSHERMQDLMKHALSVTHIRNLPSTDQRKIYALWHGFYVEMNRTAGAMKFMDEEKYYPNLQEEKQVKASANIKESILRDEQEAKKKKKKKKRR